MKEWQYNNDLVVRFRPRTGLGEARIARAGATRKEEKAMFLTTNQGPFHGATGRACRLQGSAKNPYQQTESQKVEPLIYRAPNPGVGASVPNYSAAESPLALDQTDGRALVQNPGIEAEAIKQDVMRMEQALEEALLQGDVAKLAQLLSDDVTHANPFGNLRGKQPWLAAIEAGHLKFIAFRNEDLQIRIYGETAVVTAINALKALGGRRDPSGKYRFLRVWVRQEGRWQLAAHQATRIASKPKEQSSAQTWRRRASRTAG